MARNCAAGFIVNRAFHAVPSTFVIHSNATLVHRRVAKSIPCYIPVVCLQNMAAVLKVFMPYNTEESPPPFDDAHPHEHTLWYLFLVVFRPSLYHRGTLNTTPLTKVRLKTTLNSKIITPTGGYHPPTTLTGMIWTPAWRQLLRSIKEGRTSLRPAPVPRATITSFCFRDQPACISGTSTTGTTSATPPTVPKAPATVPPLRPR